MKRKKFLKQCAERSDATVEEILERHDIVECDCGENGCPGWRAVYRFRNRMRRLGLA